MERPVVYSRWKWGQEESSVLFAVDNKRYSDALSLISSIEHELEPSLLIAQAQSYYGISKFTHALTVLQSAEARNWYLPEIYLLKGKCLFKLEEFDRAKAAFEIAHRLLPEFEVKRWIRRCEIFLLLGSEKKSPRIIRFDPPPVEVRPGTLKHNWYETQRQLSLLVFLKGVQAGQLHVQVKSDHVHVLVDFTPPLELSLKLAKEVVPEEPMITLTPMKIEIKMNKAPSSFGRWQEFEVPNG
jgi:tetratricopeptide (TPR) repeat protein